MRVLVACEESQTVCKAFRAKGHDAFSCDVKPCSGGFPEWHIQDDVLAHMDEGWDLLIAHPPCTYLTKAGACNFYHNGQRDEVRFEKQREGVEFFLKMLGASVPRICVENPVPMRTANLPPYTQVIYPELFGADYTKQTLLWLKNLPPLMPLFSGVTGALKSLCAVKRSSAARSKTFPEVAAAMAEQWNF